MKRIYLGLAIHNHQPLGNFPWVFEDSYRQAYLPMLEALERHPTISVSLHYSGCLLDWISERHPEFLALLAKLISCGQVEIMGGGYYEPILSMIPDTDKSGQIGRMSGYIQQQFGRRPRGLWLAERIWEPSLAMVLAESGIDWTLVDDTAFKMVGRSEKDLFGYFTTEEQGRYIKVFPINKQLRYSIPWHNVVDVIAYFRENASESGERIVVLGDDGEKFGVWPQTAKLCWEAGWVDDFLTSVENNGEWLSTIKLGDYAQRHGPAGRVYLPCSSYDEMLEWSLPADVSEQYMELKRRPFGDGDILNNLFSGYWRNFLVKYPEINRMQKKMLAVSSRVHRASSLDETDCGIEYLWKAQCNCPYWHGVFGGIYLPDIRATTFTNLIKAENCADAVLTDADQRYRWQQVDFDGDGHEEIIVEGEDLNLYLSPAEGGSIFEWDLRKHAYNVLSTVSRKPEAYHSVLTAGRDTHQQHQDGSGVRSIHDGVKIKDGDVADWLIYDTLPRSSLVDRFVDRQVEMMDYRKNAFEDRGDFAGQPYLCRIVPGADGLKIVLEREGALISSHSTCRLALSKNITLAHNDGSLKIDYRFENTGDISIDTIFTGEWNVNLLGGGRNEAAYYRVAGRDIADSHLDSSGEISDVSRLIMGNRYLGFELELEIDRQLTIWRYPVESISNSEAGLEKVYQCSCVVILLPLILEPGREASFNYIWRVIE
ncbi:MAG: alpha-amylase/4-alpha-glucanotransferase domain-containing protein [Dehalococcoidia bacterium]